MDPHQSSSHGGKENNALMKGGRLKNKVYSYAMVCNDVKGNLCTRGERNGLCVCVCVCGCASACVCGCVFVCASIIMR